MISFFATWLNTINIFAEISILDVWRGSEYASKSYVRSNLCSDLMQWATEGLLRFRNLLFEVHSGWNTPTYSF